MAGHRHQAILSSIGVERELVSCSLSLDDTRLPYMEAEAVVASQGGPIDFDTLQPLGNANNGIFTFERFPVDSEVADQTATFALGSRRIRLTLAGTLEVSFTSAELRLQDLPNPYLEININAPTDIPAYTVGDALDWLSNEYLVNLVNSGIFTLTGSVPSMPITLPDGAGNLTLPEGADVLLWMDPHLSRYGKVLRCNEANQFIIADRDNSVAGSVTADAAVNMVDYSEEIDRDSDLWANQVSVHYKPEGVTWISNFPEPNDPGNIVLKTAYIDRSDVPSPVNQFTTDPEVIAQGIHERYQVRYKQLRCRLISDYTWRPGMAATITNPLGQQYTAVVQSVRWFFPDGEMDVAFRNVEPI